MVVYFQGQEVRLFGSFQCRSGVGFLSTEIFPTRKEFAPNGKMNSEKNLEAGLLRTIRSFF